MTRPELAGKIQETSGLAAEKPWCMKNSASSPGGNVIPASPTTPMKRSAVLTALAALVAIVPPHRATAAHAIDPAPDCWTLQNGRVVRAHFVGFDSERLMLRQGDRFHEIRFDRLASGSREKARRLMDLETTGNVQPKPVCRPTPSATATPLTRIVTTTAYSHLESDHFPFGRRSAMGSPLRHGCEVRSAAADWSVYPAGTTFRIEGLPWIYVVDDYGSALVGTGVIDLYQPDMTAMKRWGRRTVRIAILRWGSYRDSARILSGRIRHDHCRRMYEAIGRRIHPHNPSKSGSSPAL